MYFRISKKIIKKQFLNHLYELYIVEKFCVCTRLLNLKEIINLKKRIFLI